MSNVDSSTEGSLPHSPRILGSRLRKGEKDFFVQHGWDGLLGGWTQDGAFKSIRGQTQQKPARLMAMDSDESHATRRSHKSNIHGIGLRHSDVVPIESMPASSHLRRIPSHSSQKSSDNRTSTGSLYGAPYDPSNSVLKNSSPTQLQRPPSPRSQINKSQTENRCIRIEAHSSSMDKFILQHDEPAELRPATLEEWRKLRSLRAKALRQRSRLQNMRKDLQEKQLAKSTADETFMKYVKSNRSASTESPPPSPFTADLDLDACYEAMQATRDDYGEAEFEYNSLEEALGDTEYELVKLEGHFYNPGGHDNVQSPEPEQNLQDSGGITSSAPTSLLGMSSDPEGEYEYHPSKFSYLSRLGDLDLAKERYQNMILEREKLLSTQMSRLTLGIELPNEEKAFLAEFPAQEAELLGEITEIEEDVEQLRAKCLAEGVDVRESHEVSDAGSNRSRKSNNERESVQDSGTFNKLGTTQSLKTESSYSMFSLLLPASIKGKATLDILITEFDEYNKGDRLNRWMLHKLRMSPLDADLLGRILLSFLKFITFRQWRSYLFHFQQNLLTFWGKDEPNEPAVASEPVQISLFNQKDIVQRPVSMLASTNKASAKPHRAGGIVRRVRSAPELSDLGKVALRVSDSNIATGL